MVNIKDELNETLAKIKAIPQSEDMEIEKTNLLPFIEELRKQKREYHLEFNKEFENCDSILALRILRAIFYEFKPKAETLREIQ